MTITPEELAAFADAEIIGERRAQIEAAIAADPALAQQLAAHNALKAQLSAHFAPILKAPLPDRLTVPLGGHDTVISFAGARGKLAVRKSNLRWGWVVGPALAASLAIAVFLPRGSGEAAGFAGPKLALALDEQLVATQPADASTRILVSFKRPDGSYCRAFNGSAESGIACRENRGWKLIDALPGSTGARNQFNQAGSENATLLAKVQQMADGPALDSKQEAAAARDGWR